VTLVSLNIYKIALEIHTLSKNSLKTNQLLDLFETKILTSKSAV